ncbi:MAG TPA: T9SS type A sorting domain-containing protein, partial [Chitinophagales bacterium]|nr:T9SS type A sorting domain-containing protein [Chitinophagales bacterium]
MGGFELLPNPVPASQMVYNHVGRFIFPSWNGFAAYSGAVNNGDEMVNTATFTLPAGWDDSQIHIIGMVIFNNGSSTIIDNASHTTIPTAVSNGYISGTEIPSTLGIALVESGADIALHPNPSSDQTQLNINLTEPSDIIVSVFGVEGKLLQSKHYGTLSGSNALPLASQLLTNGVYIVEVSVNGNKQALKLVKH